jgi:hypothetical protein
MLRWKAICKYCVILINRCNNDTCLSEFFEPEAYLLQEISSVYRAIGILRSSGVTMKSVDTVMASRYVK